jgi:hypothetical protein
MISVGKGSNASSRLLSRALQRGFPAGSSSQPPFIRFLSDNGKVDLPPDGVIDSNNSVYLHVGPSGDFWTGHSIFAAKHLQPDYVKSVKLDDTMDVDSLLDLLEENGDEWTHAIYDEGAFPKELLDRLDEISKE